MDAITRNNMKRNKARQNESLYAGLIDTPEDFAGGHYVLANCEFAYSCSADQAEGDVHCYIYSEPVRDLPCPELVADQIRDIGYIERGLRIGFSDGVISLYIKRNNGVYTKIGEADFT